MIRLTADELKVMRKKVMFQPRHHKPHINAEQALIMIDELLKARRVEASNSPQGGAFPPLDYALPPADESPSWLYRHRDELALACLIGVVVGLLFGGFI